MMTGRTKVTLPKRGAATPIVWSANIGRGRRCRVARKDILNATFTLLPEYENGRSAVLAAIGRPDDAVEDFDAFTELRKLVWGHR